MFFMLIALAVSGIIITYRSYNTIAIDRANYAIVDIGHDDVNAEDDFIEALDNIEAD